MLNNLGISLLNFKESTREKLSLAHKELLTLQTKELNDKIEEQQEEVVLRMRLSLGLQGV